MTGVYSLSEVRGFIEPLLRRYNAQGASLFGSYARGEATPESDLDVIVHGGKDFHRPDVFAIAEDLHEASGKRVDVYEESEIDPCSDFGRRIALERLALL